MINEKLRFGPFKSLKPIDLRETRKILEINKIIWRIPEGPYTVTMDRHFAPSDYTSYQDYFDLYDYFGPVGQALDIKNNMIWQNGFDIEAKTDSDKDKLNQLMADLAIDVTFDSKSLMGLQCGNAYSELIQERDGYELKPLDPMTMSADVDKTTGKVTLYWQKVLNQKPIDFKPEQIIHLAFRKPRGSVFGTGNLRRNLASAKALLYMRQKVPEIVRKRADNPLNVRVGDPDHRVSDEVWIKTLAVLKGHQSGEDYINDGWVTFDEVYKNMAVGRGSIVELFQIFERDLIAGVGVPEEAMGFGQSTTQATALYQREQLKQEIRKYQRDIKRLSESRIFPLAKIEHPKDARITWRPLDPEDENLKTQRIIGLVRAGIVGPPFARKQLGYPEEAGEGAEREQSGLPEALKQERLEERKRKDRSTRRRERELSRKLNVLITRYLAGEISADDARREAKKAIAEACQEITKHAVDHAAARMGVDNTDVPPEVAVGVERLSRQAYEDFDQILKDAEKR